MNIIRRLLVCVSVVAAFVASADGVYRDAQGRKQGAATTDR